MVGPLRHPNPFRASLPSLRELTRELRRLHDSARRLMPFAPGHELWVYLSPTYTDEWRVEAGPKHRQAEHVSVVGRFDPVASARRLLARARDSVAYRKGCRR